jgi:hypothetical protein
VFVRYFYFGSTQNRLVHMIDTKAIDFYSYYNSIKN